MKRSISYLKVSNANVVNQKSLCFVCHSGLDPESSIFELDSRSSPSRGQVYPCESRGGNDSFGIDVKKRWIHYTKGSTGNKIMEGGEK